MSRRKRVYKKEERVDSRYGSPAVARLITTVMKRGKKSLAERIVYTAIDKSREGSDSVDPLEVLNKALENVRPRLEVKSRRVGGATYQDRKSTRLNSSHQIISYAVFCLKKKNNYTCTTSVSIVKCMEH